MVHCVRANHEYNPPQIHQPEYTHMDPENAPSIILPIAIFIAVLAACGVIAMVLMIITGVIVLA